MAAHVEIEGFDAFRKDLRAFGRDATRDLAKANKELSEQIADKASTRAANLGGVARHVVPGIKSVGRGNGVFVRLDGASQPAIFGAEFGGGARPTTRQFQPHVGRQGYFLYPTIAEVKDSDIDKTYGQIMENLLVKHGGK